MAVIAASPRPLPVPPCRRWDVWPYSGRLVTMSQPRVSPEAWPT